MRRARAFAPAPRAPTPVRLHGAYEDAVRSSANTRLYGRMEKNETGASSHRSMPTQTSSTGRTTQTHRSQTNTQVAEAKSFSVGSPEARAAWAAVEEIEGAAQLRGHEAVARRRVRRAEPVEGSAASTRTAWPSSRPRSSKAKSDSIKVPVSKFAQTPPSSSSASPAETPGAAAAVAAAEARPEFGPTSSEAKAAWAVVEEINHSADAPAAALPGLDRDRVVAASGAPRVRRGYGVVRSLAAMNANLARRSSSSCASGLRSLSFLIAARRA